MRARNIKPSFFKNELLATSDPLNSLIFAGLWCLADRAGRLEDRPARIHFEINPGRTFESTAKAMTWLCQGGFLYRYTVDGMDFIQIANFSKHQNPHQREAASVLPEPPKEWEKQLLIDEAQPRLFLDTAKAMPSPADSPSLIPDSPFLIPEDSPSLRSGAPVSKAASKAKPIDQINGETHDAVEAIFDHWQTTWSHPRAKLDEKRRALIRKALKHYSEADLCQAITGYTNSPHHCGQNDRNTVFDSIELLLRDAKHIDAGLKFYESPPSKFSARTQANIDRTKDWRPPELRAKDGQ